MTNRKQLAKDRLLILEYMHSNDEDANMLIGQCKELANSNNPDDIEKCIDLMYEQFESEFASGALLEAFSTLIKQKV